MGLSEGALGEAGDPRCGGGADDARRQQSGALRAFVELMDVYAMESDFSTVLESKFNELIESCVVKQAA